ncbi:MAG: hypothetical protein D6768_10200, partial [Chloroflexi bacterium]
MAAIFSKQIPHKFSPLVFGLLIWLAVAGCAGQPAISPQTANPEANDTSTAGDNAISGETLHLAWTYQANGSINDSPVPVGDVVVAGPVGGPLLALDAQSGELRWQYKPEGRLWERAVAGAENLVIVGSENGVLTALDVATGEPVWSVDVGINVQMAPLVAGDVIYVPTTFVGPGIKANPQGHAKLLALNVADGTERWSAETENYILQTPFATADTVYVGGSYQNPAVEVDEGGPMRVYAFSAEDGSRRWVYEAEDGFVKAIYANDDAVAYIAYQDFANVLDAANGSLRWRKDTGNWVPSLSGSGDTVYFSSANTVIHALNTTTGKVSWKHNIGGDTFNYGLGAPVRQGDTLYVLSQRGGILALNAADGSQVWKFSSGIVGSRDGLSVNGHWIYIGDADGNIYGFT